MLLLSLSTAFAGNLDPSSMKDWAGVTYTKQGVVTEYYDTVVKQLGMSIRNRPHAPSSKGIHGFELSLQNNLSAIDSTDYSDGTPSPWHLSYSDEDAPPALWIPSFIVKKGLPLSFEIGSQAGLVIGDHGSVFGAYIRNSPFEGYAKAPDIAIQWGYAGYVSNIDMAVGVMDLTMSIGKEVPFGPLVGVNSSIFRPYVAAGMYWLRADPRLSDQEIARLGIGPVSSFAKSDYYTDGYQVFAWDLGFEVESNEIVFGLSASHSPGNLFSVQQQIGFVF
tara:strand:- start:731 stop:1561 length:831 start_codon:yes stop_codon:yes gene_type:complete